MHSQVVILNPQLTKGRCASLAARASIQAYINYIDSQDVRLWLAQGSNIIALSGGSAIELRELHNRATLRSLFTSEVYLDDKLVVVAIGPHLNESIKPLIKHLKML
jgi:peptidyl-tRNA hydrolase